MLNNYLPTHQNNLQPILSVSELNYAARNLLEQNFSHVLVTGEISNLHQHTSGHSYFSLKDHHAQIRCALFRNRKSATLVKLKDGLQVVARGQISLYEMRGDYQLIVEDIEPIGDGALRQAFELLKQKLDKEGLFDRAHKKPLPTLPKCIGLITSPTGAAVRDVLTVLKRRFPAIPVIIYPAIVQGATAAATLIQALETANQRHECDVLILTRGGGSLEDLWCFNDEALARVIYHSEIPVVSAVGHEVDFTIADFVSDQRAPTPSAAAELVSPHQNHWLELSKTYEKNLQQHIQQKLRNLTYELTALKNILRHPGQIIHEKMQRIDYLEQALWHKIQNKLHQSQSSLNTNRLHLLRQHPKFRIQQEQEKQKAKQKYLQQAMLQQLTAKYARLQELIRALDTVSPLKTLQRGYAILKNQKNRILTQTKKVKHGDSITATLADGTLVCRVLDIMTLETGSSHDATKL